MSPFPLEIPTRKPIKSHQPYVVIILTAQLTENVYKTVVEAYHGVLYGLGLKQLGSAGLIACKLTMDDFVKEIGIASPTENWYFLKSFVGNANGFSFVDSTGTTDQPSILSYFQHLKCEVKWNGGSITDLDFSARFGARKKWVYE